MVPVGIVIPGRRIAAPVGRSCGPGQHHFPTFSCRGDRGLSGHSVHPRAGRTRFLLT